MHLFLVKQRQEKQGQRQKAANAAGTDFSLEPSLFLHRHGLPPPPPTMLHSDRCRCAQEILKGLTWVHLHVPVQSTPKNLGVLRFGLAKNDEDKSESIELLIKW